MIVILVQNNACNLKAVRLAQQACYERQVGGSWCLKVDISNYFNSIDVALLPKLTFLQEENEALYGQLTALGLTVNLFGYGDPLAFEDEPVDAFTWSRWFFPLLTTDRGLREIDACLQQYLRYTITGRHYKGNYRISYEQLRQWGYVSLVHEYYRQKRQPERDFLTTCEK